jgi:hypothetical protein
MKTLYYRGIESIRLELRRRKLKKASRKYINNEEGD